MKFKDPEIEKIYDHLSKISRQAYKNPYLIANMVFSKEHTPSSVLESYLAKETPKKITFLFAIKKLILYGIKNIISFGLLVITKILHRTSGQRFQLKKEEGIILINTSFVAPQILNDGEFKDTFFPGLSDYLKKINKTYVYIPRWFDSKNPFELFRIFKILKKNQTPVLTHFQLLTPIDYLKVLRFLLFYPFSLIRFIKKLGSDYEDKLVIYALWDTLDIIVTENYMGFLLGQRLSSLSKGPIKCLSWFENQSADKNFFAGLRTQSAKTEIIGAQLFVKLNTLMNIMPDEQEIPFKVVPDKILVTGPGYRFNSNLINIDVGPALRYRYLFNLEIKKSSDKFVLVVLPFWDDVTIFILDMIREVEWESPVMIKFHPSVQWQKHKERVSENFKVTTEPLSLLLQKALIVIGHSTGALIEAISLGIPTIDIQYSEKFSHDYMQEIGRGVLWDKAKDANEIKLLIKKFQSNIKKNPESLKEEGRKMRAYCFSETTEELINQAFELE